MATERRRLDLLLVGSNSDTVRIVTAALRRSQTRCQLSTIPLGTRTLTCIRGDGQDAKRLRPDMILFDAVDADAGTLRILKAIKAEPGCQDLPIVLLSRDDSAEVLEDLQVGETRYTAFSPVDLDSFLNALNAMNANRFMQAISLLENFGFVLVRVPDGEVSASDFGKVEKALPAQKRSVPRSA
jgi:CheY-like chemotaxis protein